MQELLKYIETLKNNRDLPDAELGVLIEREEANEILPPVADAVRKERYSNTIFIRGLIDFTNYFRNNCYYCGIRAGNKNALRYRLSREEILSCANEGYELGFRTIVL